MTYQQIANDGVWTWFHDRRAVHHNGKTFVTWSANTGIWVGSVDDATLAVETFKLFDVSQMFEVNDHVVAGLRVRSDGRILAVYADHAKSPMYSRLSTNPGDVTSWGAQQTVGGTSTTYPMLDHLTTMGASGRTFLFYRTGQLAQPDRAFRYSDDDGATWTAESVFVTTPGHRPYLKMWSDGASKIHFVATDGHPRNYTTNSVYHFYYDAGTWRRSDGADMGAPPFTPSEDMTLVYDGTTNRGWLWDVCVDPDTGHPVVAYQARHSPTDIRYRYARWTGSAWVSHEVVSGGRNLYDVDGQEDDYGGGMALNHDDPSVAYISRVVAGTHELERWTTPNGGASWTSETITSGSGAGVKNYRPYYVPGNGAIELVWCRGRYTTYLDFDSDIYGLHRSAVPDPHTRRGASAVAFL